MRGNKTGGACQSELLLHTKYGVSLAERKGDRHVIRSGPEVIDSEKKIKIKIKKERKTYNSWDSHVVTHHTTNQPACGLSTAERTGSPVFHTLWSYVLDTIKHWII